MKTIIFTLFIGIQTLSILAADNTKRIKSNTKEVTVFLNGAQVNREASINIPSGTSTIIIENLTPNMVKESIQVKGLGDFTIMSINDRLEYKKKDKAVQDISGLEIRKEALNTEINKLNALMTLLQEREKLFDANKNIHTQKDGLQADQLKAMMELHGSAIKASKMEWLEHNSKILKLKKEVNQLTNKINAAQLIEQEVSTEIHIVVDSKRATKAKFNINYLITNARWFPTYDIRVDNISKPVNINYKANVSQQSGEDWTDVKLTLSTSNPNKNAQKPKLSPWYLNLNNNNSTNNYNRQNNYRNQAKFSKVGGRITDSKTGESLPFVTIQVAGTTIGTTTDMDGYYDLTLPPNGRQLIVSYIGYNRQTININNQKMDIRLAQNVQALQEVVVTSAKYDLVSADAMSVERLEMTPGRAAGATRVRGFRIKGKANQGPRKISNPIQVLPIQNVVNKQFKVDVPISIPSDMRSYSVEIEQIKSKANYEHYCIPKLDPEVFLTAQITNWEQYNLLQGQANIYFEDTYIGQSVLDVGYLSDTLTLSLGRDKSVVVTRNKVKDFTKRQLLGGNKIDSRAFEIKIRNTKNEPIKLIVEDQFPIASNNKIEVTQKEKSGGEVDEKTGIIKWSLDLNSKENKELTIQYNVKYPKEYWMGVE